MNYKKTISLNEILDDLRTQHLLYNDEFSKILLKYYNNDSIMFKYKQNIFNYLLELYFIKKFNYKIILLKTENKLIHLEYVI